MQLKKYVKAKRSETDDRQRNTVRHGKSLRTWMITRKGFTGLSVRQSKKKRQSETEHIGKEISRMPLFRTFPVHLPASVKTGRFASLQASRSFRIRSFTSLSSSLRKASLCAGCTAFPAGQFRNEGFTRGSNTWNAISAETGAAAQSNMRRS